MPKIPKIGSWQYFCNWKKKYRNCFCVLLWCKAFRYFTKFQYVRCYLFLDSCGQKWLQPFRSRNSKISFIYLKNDLMKWADFLHAVTNLGKLNVNLSITGWISSKMGKNRTVKSSVSHKWFENGVDWLNDFCMLIVIE